MGSNRGPGRPLPCQTSDIKSNRLNQDAKGLIVGLIALVQLRFGTVSKMVQHAMAAGTGKPVWAVGSPENRAHVKKACSAVSKFLGGGADRIPDWPNAEWIVRACARPDQVQRRLELMAGLWCKATGRDWPPGYIGQVDRDGSVDSLSDPSEAPDDSTRAQLYHQQLQDALATAEELSTECRELRAQLRAMQTVAARAGQQIADQEDELFRYRSGVARIDAAAGLRTVEAHLRQVEDDAARRIHQAKDRTEELYHHIAVLVADHLTGCGPGANTVLPVSGLALDVELRDLLDPPPPMYATPIARWLVLYLRSYLLLAHGHRIAEAFPTIANNLTAVLTQGQLPDPATLAPLLRTHPMLRAYLPTLLRAAHQEEAGHAPSLISVDIRTPTEQRLQDADTVRLRKPPPPRRPPPPPPGPGQQITVDELANRLGHNLNRPRRRHRPQDDTSSGNTA